MSFCGKYLSLIPSEEDSQTFHVNFASGESYKLRAANVRDRQVWVDRIRAVAHRHESAMARDNAPPIIHKEFLGMPFFNCDSAKILVFGLFGISFSKSQDLLSLDSYT